MTDKDKIIKELAEMFWKNRGSPNSTQEEMEVDMIMARQAYEKICKCPYFNIHLKMIKVGLTS
jgi:hypothetical protein